MTLHSASMQLFKFALTCALVTSTAWSLALAEIKTVEMADLKAMSEAGRDREVLRNADKVPASKRTTEWESYVTKSAKAFLKDVNDEDRSWTFDIGKALAAENPHLLKDQDFAYEVGFAGVRASSSKAVSTPFFVAALKPSDPRCKVSEVQDSVTDAFTREGFEKEKQAAKKIAFDLCRKELSADWIQKLVENDEGLKTGCAELMKLGKLKGVKAAKCKNMAKGS
ncbi:MAG: hypothetical protein EOP05_03795 [Proteobacteria bacterium]|nr:MAG: hypothetical protein EOP05_03795 [Pseudomonadota bacterium]